MSLNLQTHCRLYALIFAVAYVYLLCEIDRNYTTLYGHSIPVIAICFGVMRRIRHEYCGISKSTEKEGY